ncbi:MAG TPA: hypothetical protein VFC19_52185 [Candidatus Limnocylindrales bacterium]|nr:hypothetical protein [Candidatus Limnocylindrales bacterium]
MSAHQFSPDDLERVFHAALAAGDARGVEAALTLLAPLDPRRAQRLFDDTKRALAIALLLRDDEVPG